MKTTRFPNGLTNVAQRSTLGAFGALDPTRFHTFFDDFDRFAAADWVITKTEIGAGNAATALTDADGGVLLITNDAADNDAVFFNKAGESFLMQAGKEAWFKARFKISDAVQSDLIIGLQVTDTTPLDAVDGIYFMKDDGDALLDFYVRKDATTGSNSALGVATVASDTWMSVGWYYDGKGSVGYFVNDQQLGSLSASAAYLPDTELTVSFGVQNGEAVIKTMSVDYIFASKLR